VPTQHVSTLISRTSWAKVVAAPGAGLGVGAAEWRRDAAAIPATGTEVEPAGTELVMAPGPAVRLKVAERAGNTTVFTASLTERSTAGTDLAAAASAGATTAATERGGDSAATVFTAAGTKSTIRVGIGGCGGRRNHCCGQNGTGNHAETGGDFTTS